MDKCTTYANRVIASPKCTECDGEFNYVAMEPEKSNLAELKG